MIYNGLKIQSGNCRPQIIYSVSDRPQRTNTYTAEATNDRYRQYLFGWLAVQPPLWNQITYRRRQGYFSEDGDVWDAEYTDLYRRSRPSASGLDPGGECRKLG